MHTIIDAGEGGVRELIDFDGNQGTRSLGPDCCSEPPRSCADVENSFAFHPTFKLGERPRVTGAP